MDRKTLLSSAGILVLFVVAAVLGVSLPEQAEPLAVERGALLCATESGNCVESWNGSDIVTYSDAGSTQTALIDGATGAATFANDVTVDDVFNVDENDNAQTGAQTLVPTATYYQFSPTSVLTLTISTTGVLEGDFLILHNLVTTSTTIADTGATVGGGVVTLGQDDLAMFIYGDGVWIEIASPDNS